MNMQLYLKKKKKEKEKKEKKKNKQMSFIIWLQRSLGWLFRPDWLG